MIAWCNAKKDDGAEHPPRRVFGEYLIDMLEDMGFTQYDRPHDYTNLVSYGKACGYNFSEWELTTLRFLSTVYVNDFIKYSDRDDRSLAPYISQSDANKKRDFIIKARRKALGV